MVQTRYFIPLCSLVLLGLLLAATFHLAQAGSGHHEMINLHPNGPQPRRLEVAPDTDVLWISHLANTALVVVSIDFLEGERVAQATTPVEGFNGFDLEGRLFVGRMAGNGGKVALRFVTPGEYTYTVDHGKHLGTIVVRK